MRKWQIDWLSAFSWAVVGVASAIVVVQIAMTFIWGEPFNTPLFTAIFVGVIVFAYRWIRHAGEMAVKDEIIERLKRDIYELGGSPSPWIESDEDGIKEWEGADGQIRLNKGAKKQLRKILGESAID